MGKDKKKKKEKINEAGVPYGAREHMPLWYPLAWSTRGISAALNVVFIGYISYYASDVLGLNVTIIGTMLLASKVIDALTDLCMGYIVDKTHTRFGKGRPYEVFIILEWIITIAMYAVPTGLSTMGKYLWIFVTYVLINAVCATALGGVDSVYMARCFTSDKNRINAMSVNGVVVMICAIIFNIIFPQFVASAGTDPAAWAQLAVIMGIPLAIIGILRFVICKEVPVDEAAEAAEAKAKAEKKKAEKMSLKEMLRIVLKNKYLYFLVVFMFVTYVINNIGTATTYYFKYIVGDISLQSLVSMTSLSTPVVLVFFPLLAKKFGTTNLLRIGMGMGIVGMIIRIIGGANMTTLIIGSLFAGIATLPISMMINTYLIDTMDYGEWKSGVRIEGLYASINNFAGKLGQGCASGLVGLVLGLAGYDGTLEVQSASATAAIGGMYNVFPLICYAIMFIFAMLYKMDDERPQMQADLAARRAAKGQAQ